MTLILFGGVKIHIEQMIMRLSLFLCKFMYMFCVFWWRNSIFFSFFSRSILSALVFEMNTNELTNTFINRQTQWMYAVWTSKNNAIIWPFGVQKQTIIPNQQQLTCIQRCTFSSELNKRNANKQTIFMYITQHISINTQLPSYSHNNAHRD